MGKTPISHIIQSLGGEYLTIIPRAQMGSELIAYEAEGQMGYRLSGHEGERNNCSSKIQLVSQKISRIIDFNPFLPPKSSRFSLLVGYNI